MCIQCFESEPLKRMRALKPEWSYLKLCSTEAWLTDVGADRHAVKEAAWRPRAVSASAGVALPYASALEAV